MYGSSGKLRRGGGGRGGAGRNRDIHSSFHPSPLNRPSSNAGRPSMAGAGAAPRNRAVSPLVPAASTPSTAAAIEETYSLFTSNPLNFGMTIRLAPNLVEEIKRVEAQGGVARIKFDGNTNNPVGNIISVGGKEFKFTWSPETGDLCDIYEERQSGEDGTGLLVESGSAWRKLNVQRVLDESTKNHVKLRSEEAERKNKSRKAIVLDHRNPSTKSQFKALASSESNPCRNFKTKKEQPPPAKKRKVEPVSGPPKSVHKSGSVGTATTKGRTPTSPLVSPPEHLGAPTSPKRCVNMAKGHANKEKSTQDVSKSTNYDKDIGRPLVDSYLQEKPGSRTTAINQPSDLRTVLISLLKESSLKGMSLKALEKAAEEAIPNSVRQIKSILKEIATFQAPGKYFLKSGVEIESLKKPLLDKQSSPEDTLQPSAENEKNQQDHSELTLPMRIDSGELDENMRLRSISQEEPGFLEKVAALNTDTFDAKMITRNSEGPAVSSSDSDSENDSSSESLSRSRSISLSGSGSESSSDSESDASTNDHEMSDDDVDIMTTDNDGEKHQLQASASVLPKSLIVSGGGMDGQHGLIEISKPEDDRNMVDIVKKDFHERSVLISQTANALRDGSAGNAGPNVLERDIPRPHQRASQYKRSDQPRVDRVDIVTQSNMGIEMGGRDSLGHIDRIVDTATEVHGKRHGILAANVPEEHGSQGGNIHRKPKPYTLADLDDKHKDASLTGSNDSNQRRRESSSDETSCPYSKYEKEEPQLKGSIRDFSEYAEYVKEYKEKYDIYVSLDKVLESSREEFLKHHRESKAAANKDPEKYSKLVRQIKESFGQSAERHKRLKRIFVVLYEESVNLKQKIKEFAAPYLKNE